MNNSGRMWENEGKMVVIYWFGDQFSPVTVEKLNKELTEEQMAHFSNIGY